MGPMLTFLVIAIVGAVSAGLAIVQVGFAPVFVLAAGIMLLNAVVFLAYFRRWRMPDGK